MPAERPLFEEEKPLSPLEQFNKAMEAFRQDQSKTQEEKDKILKKFDPKIKQKLESNDLHDGKIGVMTTTKGTMTDDERAMLTNLGMNINYPNNRIQLGHVTPDRLIQLASMDTIRYINHSILSPKKYN